jgi:hypothetical protein
MVFCSKLRIEEIFDFHVEEFDLSFWFSNLKN